MNLEIYLKINVSCEASINFHHVSQNTTPRFAKNTQHDTSAAPATKNASSENDAKILRLPHQKTIFDTLWNMLECQSTTPATWNEATWRLKPPKVTTFAELAIGTAIATSLSMVADDCRRLQTVAVAEAASSEHVSTPDPQSKTRTLHNPSLRIRETTLAGYGYFPFIAKKVKD